MKPRTLMCIRTRTLIALLAIPIAQLIALLAIPVALRRNKLNRSKTRVIPSAQNSAARISPKPSTTKRAARKTHQ